MITAAVAVLVVALCLYAQDRRDKRFHAAQDRLLDMVHEMGERIQRPELPPVPPFVRHLEPVAELNEEDPELGSWLAR
jgi:hypothetical protein